MVLKHTDFMPFIANQLAEHLPNTLHGYHFGETRWLCQVYYGSEKRVHYEVARVWNHAGRQVEIGLHFEMRDNAFNRQQLILLDQHLIEIQAALEGEVKAEFWDKGWTKLYQLLLEPELSEDFALTTTQSLAQFISIVEPIYRKCLL